MSSWSALRRRLQQGGSVVDRLDAFPSVIVSGVEIVVDRARPVAAVLAAEERTRLVTWPDLDVGLVEPLPTLLPAPDGAWVHYPPSTVSLMDDSHHDLLLDRDSPAVRIGSDGSVSVVRLGDRRAIGATRGVLWTATDQVQVLDDFYRGGPMPEGWEEPTLLTLVRPGGSTTQLRVDRHVLEVFEADGSVHIVVAPTPPVAVPGDFGSISYDYRISEIALPAGDPFPDDLRFLDLHPDGTGPKVQPRRCWWAADDGIAPASTRTIDLDSVAGSRWTRIGLTDQQIRDATAAASRWFGDPDEFWHGADGATSPLTSGMTDAEVHLEDDWPLTRVVVTFAHPWWPEGRLRRSVRVFDEAGRLTSNPYVDVHLMEDLDTGHLPPVEEARDGYLDI